MSRVSFENKTGYKLKITYDDKIYDLECTQRVLIPIYPDKSKIIKISINEDYYFDKVMFTSFFSLRTTIKGRMSWLCYFLKFDMLFYDKDITTQKVVINQHIRRFEYEVLFPLLSLDVKIPVKYSFYDEKQKIKLKIFNLLNHLFIGSFYFLLGCAGVVALCSELDSFNLIFGLTASIVGFGVFVKSIKKRYKLSNFNKYFEDILLFDSVPCLPIKIRKRTIIFDDEE